MSLRSSDVAGDKMNYDNMSSAEQLHPLSVIVHMRVSLQEVNHDEAQNLAKSMR